MIPRANITAWRIIAPWPLDEQVEQDLVLSRALAEIFSRPALRSGLAFRGGTALHKLCFETPGRYSEDLDLVQVAAGPIRPLVEELQRALDPWLGKPAIEPRHDGIRLQYSYLSTVEPVRRMRVKIEVNTREHFAVDGFRESPYAIENPWHSADVRVTTYSVEELLATKLRALYQRRKGRDLFDLSQALTLLRPDEERVVRCMETYLANAGMAVSRAEYEANMARKLSSPDFPGDVVPLLVTGAAYQVDEAFALVHERLISRMRGEAWRGR